MLRRNLNTRHHAGLGGGRVFQETIEQQLHAEIVAGAAKKNRRGFLREHRRVIPIVPGVFEHFEFFNRFVKRRVIETATDDFIMQPADLHRRAVLPPHRALE